MANAMSPHPHARQKLWEAVGCLIGTKPFRDRLTNARGVLVQIHSNERAQLPENVREKLDPVLSALAKHPDEWEGDEITANILSIFVELMGGL
jgi:hypothetical protein